MKGPDYNGMLQTIMERISEKKASERDIYDLSLTYAVKRVRLALRESGGSVTYDEMNRARFSAFDLVRAMEEGARLASEIGVDSNGTSVSERMRQVDHPDYYQNKGGKECIDGMAETFGIDAVASFCACSAYKYLYRMGHKGDANTDIRKAQWYVDKHNALTHSRLTMDTLMRAVEHFKDN